MSGMKRLKDVAYTHQRQKHSLVPEHALVVHRYTDKTANGLTRCVIDWLRFNGHQAERINSMGRPIDRRRVARDVVGRPRIIGSVEWITGTGTRGTSDISATIKGKSVKIEVKAGNDKQSEHQKKYQKQVEAAGGTYIIARTFESFLDWYDNFLQ